MWATFWTDKAFPWLGFHRWVYNADLDETQENCLTLLLSQTY